MLSFFSSNDDCPVFKEILEQKPMWTKLSLEEKKDSITKLVHLNSKQQ